MKQFEIEQSNELIANFMELKSYEDLRYGKMYQPSKGGPSVWQLDYHSSWDWLMPVVEKIVYEVVGKAHPLTSETEINYFKRIGSKWQKLQRALITPVDLSKQKPIDAVWKAVVDFIKWLNAEQKVQECDATDAQPKN